MRSRDHVMYFCEVCQKSDVIDMTQEDRELADKNGGLFTRIVNHNNHVLELIIDVNGYVRGENLFRNEILYESAKSISE